MPRQYELVLSVTEDFRTQRSPSPGVTHQAIRPETKIRDELYRTGTYASDPAPTRSSPVLACGNLPYETASLQVHPRNVRPSVTTREPVAEFESPGSLPEIRRSSSARPRRP